MFSGTDNGLVSMTETVNSTPERFRFHLRLYNLFSVLAEDEQPQHVSLSEEKKKLVMLPTSFKISGKEIQFGSGTIKRRKQLEKSKNLPGERINHIEKNMGDNSLHDARSLDDIEARYSNAIQDQEYFRKFYYTPRKCKQKYAQELAKLCSSGRKFIKSQQEIMPIFFYW
ncbi:hypothetical protein EDC94DRAFT_386287 [Helicostylum pulchrum]|nr:hypothetical protein EDC94DRAFT_386287 [Helicostylum pulchrum]